MSEPILILPAWITAALGTLGLGAGAVTMVPQISKIVNDKSAKGTSWAMAAINGFGTSILLAFCGATVTIVGVGPVALGLGITTLTLAGIRTISGITLIGMKYHYDYKYLDNKINTIKDLIVNLSIYSKAPNKYLLDLLNQINESRSVNIGKKTISNKQVSELKKEAIDNFIKIINYLDSNIFNKKEKIFADQIKKEILELLFAGKYYQKASNEMQNLTPQTEKINEIFKKLTMQNDHSIQTKLNNLNKQVDHFKELIKQLDKLKGEKNTRLERNVVFRGIKKFSKDTLPFAFGKNLKKLNKEVSAKMNEIYSVKEELKEILNFIGEKHLNELNEDDKKIIIEIASNLYSEEIQCAIKNGELKIVNSHELDQLSETINIISENNKDQSSNQITITAEQFEELSKQTNLLKNPIFNFQDAHNIQGTKTIQGN